MMMCRDLFANSNAEEGFAIEGGGEYVGALIYSPRAKDNYLRCRRVSPSRQVQKEERCTQMLVG